jgi:hypothetical protein
MASRHIGTWPGAYPGRQSTPARDWFGNLIWIISHVIYKMCIYIYRFISSWEYSQVFSVLMFFLEPNFQRYALIVVDAHFQSELFNCESGKTSQLLWSRDSFRSWWIYSESEVQGPIREFCESPFSFTLHDLHISSSALLFNSQIYLIHKDWQIRIPMEQVLIIPLGLIRSFLDRRVS